MKMNLTVFNKLSLVLLLALFSASQLYAGAPPPPPPPPAGIPVDAGAILLLIAGASMGASRLMKRKSASE